MYHFLKGTLAYKGESLTGGHYLAVDVGGVGYQVHTNLASFQVLKPKDEVTIYTTLIVREDAMQMVGFLTREERDMYDILASASGVGMKVALSLLSHLSVSELAMAIMNDDHKRLTAAKGVGPKLAQKMTLELKDKMSQWREMKLSNDTRDMLASSSPLPRVQAYEEAETVLLSLGYSVSEIHQALQALQQHPQASTQYTAEEVLQFILKWLATHSV